MILNQSHRRERCLLAGLGITVTLTIQAADAVLDNVIVNDGILFTPTNNIHLRISPPGEHSSSGTFNISSQSNNNQVGETRPNDVFRISYNMAPGGGREVGSDGAFGFEFESHYSPSPAERWFEQHLTFNGIDGSSFRPWTWIFVKQAENPTRLHYIEHGIWVDRLSFQSPNGANQWMIFKPNSNLPEAGGEIIWIGPTALAISKNNYSPFYQLSRTGASRSLIYLDDQDRIRLGASGDAVALSEKLLWEQDAVHDIGLCSANRPRDVHVGRHAFVSGSVGVGTAAPYYRLHVNGRVAGTGPYISLSDGRFKTDVRPITNALEKVSALRGISFSWRQETNSMWELEDRPQIGFIGQEVQEVIPEAVSEDGQGVLGIAEAKIVPVLVEAVKTLQHKLSEQARTAETREKALEQRLAELEARLSALSRYDPRTERPARAGVY